MKILETTTKAEYEITPNGISVTEKLKCPVCKNEDKRSNPDDPSLSWNNNEKVGKCHYCESRFVEPADEEPQDKPTSTSPRKPETPKPNPAPQGQPISEFAPMLAERNISIATAQKLGVQEGWAFMPQERQQVFTLQFPFTIHEQEVNRKYRDGQKNFCLTKGATRVFQGLDDVQPYETAIIVEGEFDKLALAEVGYWNVLSVPNGGLNSANATGQLQFYENSAPYLQHITRFVLMLDEDQPGRQMRDMLADQIGRHRCYVASLPAKDANDTLLNHGPEALHQAISEAHVLPPAGVQSFGSIAGHIDKLFREGIQKRAQLGFPKLDAALDLQPGLLSTWVGIPGHGKSTFVNQVITLLSQKDWKWAVYSPEHDAGINFVSLAKTLMGKQFFPDANPPKMTMQDKDYALQHFDQRVFNIYPEGDFHNIEAIIQAVKGLNETIGLDGLVIDPFNSVDHDFYTDHQHIGRALSKLNRIKNELDIHILIVAHPTKMQKNPEYGEYPTPTPYDIDGSAHWFNKSDIICSVKRGLDDVTTVKTQKMKYEGLLGKKDQEIDFDFDPKANRFYEMQDAGGTTYPGGAVPVNESATMPEEPPF